MRRRAAKNDAAGYLLFETAALGLIVLAMAAVLGIFARTALLEAEGRTRMDAALIAREEFSLLAVRLDAGENIENGTITVLRNDVDYTMTIQIEADGIFYDVTLRISWTVWGRERTAEFVRRLRAHGT